MTTKKNYSTLAIVVTRTKPGAVLYKRIDSDIEKIHFSADKLHELLKCGHSYLVTAHN